MLNVIRNAEIYRGGKFVKEDLWFADEYIVDVPQDKRVAITQEIDAKGQTIFPGLIDVHVHFREPGMEHKEGWINGSWAAARGGVTTVLEIQNNPPLSIDAQSVRERRRLAARGVVDFGCYGNLLPKALENLESMAPLVAGFKLFMGNSTGMQGLEERKVLRDLFAGAARAGKIIVAHCEAESVLKKHYPAARNASAAEHHRLRPPEAEHQAIERALELVADTGAQFHVFHLSTQRGVQLIAQAKQQGLPVSASVSIHNLLFTCEDTARLGNFLRVNPPLQTAADREALLQAVKDNTVEIIATDHAPHFRAEKEKPYFAAPSGIPALEFFLPLVLTLVEQGSLPLLRALDAVTQAPARIFGLANKGQLQTNYFADFVVCERKAEHMIEDKDIVSRAGWSPYLRKTVVGMPKITAVRGKFVWQQGKFLSEAWGKPITTL